MDYGYGASAGIIGPGWVNVVLSSSNVRYVGYLAEPWVHDEATLSNVTHLGTEERPSYVYGGVPAGGELPMPIRVSWADVAALELLPSQQQDPYLMYQQQAQAQALAMAQQQAYAALSARASATRHGAEAAAKAAHGGQGAAAPAAERRELKAAPVPAAVPARKPAATPPAPPPAVTPQPPPRPEHSLTFGSYLPEEALALPLPLPAAPSADAGSPVAEAEARASPDSLAATLEKASLSGRAGREASPATPPEQPPASRATPPAKPLPKPRHGAAPAPPGLAKPPAADSPPKEGAETVESLSAEVGALKARAAAAERECDRLREATLCSICLDAPRCLALLPCAHCALAHRETRLRRLTPAAPPVTLCAASACLKTIGGTCPICRKAVLRTQKVFPH